MILDAGFLISVDRGERAAQEFLTAALHRRTPLDVTHPVVARVWRDGSRQSRLARFLRTVEVHRFDDGPNVGMLLARVRTSDVVDAHLVLLALQLSEPILSGDVDDLSTIIDAIGDPRPQLHAWPPPD